MIKSRLLKVNHCVTAKPSKSFGKRLESRHSCAQFRRNPLVCIKFVKIFIKI